MNRLRQALLFAAFLGMVVVGYFGWKNASARREWAAMRPMLPSPVGESAPGLDARLRAAEERLVKWPPDANALAEFTRVCHANGELNAAISGYQALIKLNPNEPRWPYRLASILAGYGRLDEALPLLRRTVELAPDYSTARLKLAEALLKSNATAEAEAAFREVLQRDADNAHAMLGLARCDLQADRLTAARSQLQRAVAAHPDSASAQSLLGSVFERLGNMEGAELARAHVRSDGHYTEPPDPWLTELISDCHDPYMLLTAASAAFADGRSRDALSILDRGLALSPNDARLHRQLARIRTSMGELETARSEMERAVALEPANDAIHLDLLAILRQMQDSAAFDDAVARGVAACPASSALRYEAGLIASHAGRLDEALGHLDYAWRNRPDQTAAAFEAANIYFRRSQPEAAVKILEDVLAHHPRDSAAALMLARHGIQSGDSRTPTWLQRATDANPSAPVLAELRQDYHRRFGVSP